MTEFISKILPELIAGAFVLLAGWAVYLREKKKAREEAHREKKVVIYQNFSWMTFELLKRIKKGDTKDFAESDEFLEKMWDLKEGILFYASPKVIRAFNEWLKNSENPDRSHKAVMGGIGDVFLAMREDLGLDNRGLNNLNIHQIYTTDDLSELK